MGGEQETRAWLWNKLPTRSGRSAPAAMGKAAKALPCWVSRPR
jgi:hypothetical protein